jgi:hypothetical protein
MKPLLIVLGALICAMSLKAQKQDMLPPGEVKEWRFPVRDGELVITLFSFADSHGSRNAISITTSGTAASPTVDDESSCLQKVIADMPSLGYDPQFINSIHMGILEPDTLSRLQLAAANSKEWRNCTYAKECNGTEIVLRLLQGLRAYDRLSDDLSKYGLMVKLTFLEDMLVRPVPDPRDYKSQKKIAMPVAGLMEFSVSHRPASLDAHP